MTKKIQALNNWLSAHDAAQVLSLTHERPRQPPSIPSLATRKKQPVRTPQRSTWLLDHGDDILACARKEKQNKSITTHL